MLLFLPGSTLGRLCLVATSWSLVSFAAWAEEPSQKALDRLPPLVEPIASFGAAVADDHLYVYSGHTGKAHEHSRRNLSQHFRRLKLDGHASWQALPMGPALQSVALVAHGGNVYRVGGMLARNEPDEADDLLSVPDCAKFDTTNQTWHSLRPLPRGRSSHDAVVVGNTLYVVGGWQLGGDAYWHDTALSLQLDDPTANWVPLPPQPFQRRALAVVEHRGAIYALGGMTSGDQATTEVHGFDLAKQTWFVAPSLPGKPMQGFGCAALSIGGHLIATTMNGEVHQLSDDGQRWQTIGKLSEPRFFHRLVTHSGAAWAIAGANTRGHLDTLERLNLPFAPSGATASGVQP